MARNARNGGVYCDEESILQRDGMGIEKEADEFAAGLLMPFHDFRRQLPANERPDFKRLSAIAQRYGVSLTAAILRWLECTDTRAMMVASNEGYALWARSSDAALKSGRFIRTKKRYSSYRRRHLQPSDNLPRKQKRGWLSQLGLGDFRKGTPRCASGPKRMTKKSPFSISKKARQLLLVKKLIWKIPTIAL